MSSKHFLKLRTKEIKKAVGSLEGLKRAICMELGTETPNHYTLSLLTDGVGVLADYIDSKICDIEKLSGIPEHD